MSSIDLPKAKRQELLSKLQDYLGENLDIELEQFDADFLLDFIGENMGPYFYNQGLLDAQALILSRIESIGEAIYDIEKPLP